MSGRRGLDPHGQPFGGKRFLCRPLSTSRVDGDSRLVHVSGARAAEVVENGILALAERLQTWATFDEHLSAMESAGMALSGRDLAGALEELQRIGALWFADDFLKALGGHAPRPAAPIETLVWCTKDRPEVLGRSISSFLSRGFEPAPRRVIVCDDSTDPETVRHTAEAIDAAARDSSVPAARCFHVSMEAKLRMISTLQKLGASRGIAPQVVEFILCNNFELPLSEGANRNFALLLTAGEAFCSTDDDTMAEAG